MTDAAILYRSHVEAIEKLPESEQLAAYKAIVSYCMDGEIPEDGVACAIVMMARPVLDKWIARREAGAKGGNREKQEESTAEANEKQTVSKHEANEKQTEANRKQTEPKEKEKVKDKENLSPQGDRQKKADEIVAYLNAKTGKLYRRGSRDTVKHINARLAEGFSVDDFKAVIDKKTAEWKGTDMDGYLRPQTLFGSKFESYLQAKPGKPRAAPKGNSFTEIGKHDYDFDQMERQLLEQRLSGTG